MLIDSAAISYLDSAFGDGTSIWFQRQLEQVLAKVYNVRYANLPHRELFPVSNEVNPAAETITYHVFDKVGVAKILAAYAQDLPLADVFAKEVKSPIKGIGSSFSTNTDEIRKGVWQKTALEPMKALASRRAVEELFNLIAFNGDADTGLPGFLTNPNITTTTVPNGAGGDPEWNTKTPDEILFDVNSLFDGIFTLTKMVERPNTLLLPPAQYSFISATPRSSTSDTTILQYIINNSPYISSAADIIPVNQMTGSGAGNTDQMAAYDKSPEKLQNHIPMEQMFHPPQRKGLSFVTPSEARAGGVIIYYPLSVALAQGI